VIHLDAAIALRHAFADGLDAVTVASSRTMEFLHRALPDDLRVILKRTPIVSIGPITSATASAMGYDVAEEAERATLEDLIDALERALSQADESRLF
jgi:uroporphyrinogen-III synthase